MNRIMRYLTHPQVSIDPHTPVGHWSLSHEGLMRTNKVATATGLSKTTQIISSAETKARQTAMIIAKSLKLEISVRERMHENDRSSTGFLPLAEFEAMADDFFAHPGQSVDGWERAIDAQKRIVGETNQIITQHDGGDLLLVGHGAVGSFYIAILQTGPLVAHLISQQVAAIILLWRLKPGAFCIIGNPWKLYCRSRYCE